MIKMETFINNEFKQFSNYDNERNIPDIRDGLKISQRKVLYAALKFCKNTNEKVAQLGAFASKETHYLHGEDNLNGTIVGMAQDFTGSNNVNLLLPVGQFGSIVSPDASSPRYIFTKVSENYDKYFKKEDNCILNYREEEGYVIEPEVYFPLIPVCLMNGSVGIGTGHSTKILSYHPQHLLRNVRRVIEGKNQRKMVPYYNGYKGKVERDDTNQITFTGVFEIVNSTTIKITTLPIGYTKEKYKQVLNKLMDDCIIKDYENNSNEDGWEFIVIVPRSTTKLDYDDIITKFKLQKKVTENFTLWNVDGKLKRFATIEDVVEAFTKYRLDIYEKSRLQQITDSEKTLGFVLLKLLFLDIFMQLSKNKTPTENELRKAIEKDDCFSEEHFNKLMNMPIRSLTKEMVSKTIAEKLTLIKHIKELKGTTNNKMYLDHIEELV